MGDLSDSQDSSSQIETAGYSAGQIVQTTPPYVTGMICPQVRQDVFIKRKG